MGQDFDVVVIGSGPGGYYAAIRCAQKGAAVAIIEKADIGGTCLNRGCIPSKALLASAEALLHAQNAAALGVDIPAVSPNWLKMQQRKDMIVGGFRKGLAGLLQANKITIFQGNATVASHKAVVIDSVGGRTEINANKGIIIATGSVPIEIPAFPFDGQTAISSNEALG